jgi:hypothetical protein
LADLPERIRPSYIWQRHHGAAWHPDCETEEDDLLATHLAGILAMIRLPLTPWLNRTTRNPQGPRRRSAASIRQRSRLVLESLEGRCVPSTTVYDAAADFSATDNPNGAWSYGWSHTLGGGFILYTDHRAGIPGLDSWLGDQAPDGNPSLAHNGTDHVIIATTPPGIIWQPGQLSLHPGPNGEYSLIRWTAPAAGVIAVNATFSGIDAVGGTTTDVHVLHQGLSQFDGRVNGYLAATSFTGNLTVARGDTVDFAVGYGTDHTFYYDTTALAATISYTARASLVGRDTATGQWWVGRSYGSGFDNVLADAWDPSAAWVDVQTGDFTGHGFRHHRP